MKNSRILQLDKYDFLHFISLLIVIYFTWLFMDGASHFLELTQEALGKYYDYKWVIIAHITGGGGALILGLIQFWTKLRIYSSKAHRTIGLLYLLAILLSSSCALILAFTTSYEVTLAYAFTLQVWVAVWISSTCIAYFFALKKNWKLHQEWMTRSYIVTIAFLISGLLFKIPAIQQLGSFEDISPSLFWLGWALPLYLYDIYLSKSRIGTK